MVDSSDDTRAGVRTLTLTINKGTFIVFALDSKTSTRAETWRSNLAAAFQVAATNSNLYDKNVQQSCEERTRIIVVVRYILHVYGIGEECAILKKEAYAAQT
jgi:hypothetical protein